MKTAKLMRIVARLSLLYAILDYIFAVTENTVGSAAIFLWFCCITFVFSTFLNKNKFLLVLGIAAEGMPLTVTGGVTSDIFYMYIVIIAYCIYYILRDVKSINYGDYIEEFKKSLILFAMVLFFALWDLNNFSQNPAFYILIYLVDSIMLLRLLRDVEYIGDNKYVMHQNIKYCVVFLSAAFLFSLNIVRECIIKVLDIIGIGLYYIAFVVAVGLGSIFYFIIEGGAYLIRLFGKLGGIKTGNTDPYETPQSPSEQIKPVATIVQKALQNKALDYALMAVLIFILIIMFIRFFRKRTRGLIYGGDFVEVKEYIKSDKAGNGRIDEFWARFRPKDYLEQVRYNYYRFLKHCQKIGIQIKKEDTTLDINKKARGVLDNSDLKGFRNIYIKARYSGSSVDKEEVSRASEIYKKFKNSTK